MISPPAKKLIKKFLTVNPNHRFTAAQALVHPWIIQNIDESKKDSKIDPNILINLTHFRYPASFCKEVMKVMVD